MSACISGVSEKDFEALSWAASEAQKRGDMQTALALDKMARKANVSLTYHKYKWMEVWTPNPKRLTWKEVPSTLL
jgi:hypothetical protein